jgi:serine/threonine-protein kinase
VLYDRIASGGMASVHLGRLMGPAGFSRTVAIKKLHAQYAQDIEFVAMLVDEARLVARIRHPNVVPTLDVVVTDGEVFLVMEYVQGEALSRLIRNAGYNGERIPPAMAATILAGVLHGLQAAHEARGERNELLGIVHRDVSPQNVLVGVDGVARVLDFGIAKAAGRAQTTRDGQLKGKLAYMAPEQIDGVTSRATDVYAAAAVLWETLTGRRLFTGENEPAIMKQVLEGRIVAPSELASGIPAVLDAIVLRGLSARPEDRFATAGEMAVALEDALPPVPASRIGHWVGAAAQEALSGRTQRLAVIESSSSHDAISLGSLLARPPTLRDAVPSVALETTPDNERTLGTQLATGISRPDQSIAPDRRRKLPWRIGGGVAAGAAALALLVFALTARRAAPVGTAHQPVPPAPDPPATTEAPRAAPPPLDPPSAPIAIPADPPAPAPPRRAPVERAAPPVRTAPVRKSPSSACTPPYYFDAEGNRVFKKECL